MTAEEIHSKFIKLWIENTNKIINKLKSDTKIFTIDNTDGDRTDYYIDTYVKSSFDYTERAYYAILEVNNN